LARPFFGMSNRRIALGHRGEDMAAEWYSDHGYEILARNWRCHIGEIDILCAQVDGAGCSVLVVCEVKARTSNSLGNPFEAVTHAKQHRLRCLATAYLSEQDTYYDHIRFDVAGVSGRALRVVENAF
jgi:putative endonuclease